MKYENPILRGMNPDPSICRVQNDYYLVTSTFEYFPGIPIYHSRDLVNWTQIGNAVERPEQLPLARSKSSGGIWAPTIRYYGGKFYITATFDGMGNFIISSDRPESGWSDPVWTEMDGIDPSLFFEDEKLYFCANDCGSRGGNGEGISLAEINCTTGELIGNIRRIWEGTGGGFLEAPHIYHIGKYYYLLAAEGGTGANHMITVARSSEIWGPYECCPENPVLTNRNDTSKKISCSGHGDLTDDAEGNLWLVHLGIRPVSGLSHLGRETFLMPAALKNDWLAVGHDKKSHIEINTPRIKAVQRLTCRTYDFSKDTIGCEWLYRRIPNFENYAVNNGMLIIKASDVRLKDGFGSPSFLALRQPDLKCSFSAELGVKNLCDGTRGGMAVYLSENFFCRIYVEKDSGKSYIAADRLADDMYVKFFRAEASGEKLTFKITTDGRKYYFYYAEDGEDIYAGSVSTKFLSTQIAGKCFTGVMIGFFAEGKKGDAAELFIKRLVVSLDADTAETHGNKNIPGFTAMPREN